MAEETLDPQSQLIHDEVTELYDEGVLTESEYTTFKNALGQTERRLRPALVLSLTVIGSDNFRAAQRILSTIQGECTCLDLMLCLTIANRSPLMFTFLIKNVPLYTLPPPRVQRPNSHNLSPIVFTYMNVLRILTRDRTHNTFADAWLTLFCAQDQIRNNRPAIPLLGISALRRWTTIFFLDGSEIISANSGNLNYYAAIQAIIHEDVDLLETLLDMNIITGVEIPIQAQRLSFRVLGDDATTRTVAPCLMGETRVQIIQYAVKRIIPSNSIVFETFMTNLRNFLRSNTKFRSHEEAIASDLENILRERDTLKGKATYEIWRILNLHIKDKPRADMCDVSEWRRSVETDSVDQLPIPGPMKAYLHKYRIYTFDSSNQWRSNN